MKIIEDVAYITRLFTIQGSSSTYTVTYSEGRSNFSWTIDAEADLGTYGVDTESDLGLRLISLCVEAMGIEN